MTRDFVASAKWLKARPESNGRTAAPIAFCFGSGVANTLAVRLPDLGAAVPFYGTPASLERSSGDQSRGARPSSRARTPNLRRRGPTYNAQLTAAKVTHDGYIYLGANHGFHNDTTPRYDPAAATLAWQRTTAWFAKYLNGVRRTRSSPPPRTRRSVNFSCQAEFKRGIDHVRRERPPT